jgi:hypothetical protein
MPHAIKATHWYWCPEWWPPWNWIAKWCKRESDTWQYDFDSIVYYRYIFFAYCIGCENGLRYTWHEPHVGLGGDTEHKSPQIFSHKLESKGSCGEPGAGYGSTSDALRVVVVFAIGRLKVVVRPIGRLVVIPFISRLKTRRHYLRIRRHRIRTRDSGQRGDRSGEHAGKEQ